MNKKVQISESIELGILLALSGGFMDAYSYIGRGEVFANAQTGNMLLLGVHLSDFLWILQNWKVERSCFKNGRLDEESSKSHPLYL